MKRTVNRTPGQVPIVGSDSRTDNLNLVSFEGITNSENDLTVSPSTFTDANNMYVNSKDLLSSRPTIKSTKYLNKDFVVLEDVKNTWVVDDLLIYHKGSKLKFIKNNVPSEVEIEVGEKIDVLESVENYILIYPANKYIDVSSKNAEGVLLYKFGDISEICYIPTTELRSGNETSYPEKPNRLSPYSKHSVIYDKSIYTDLSEFYGKDVEVLIGDKTYHIENYREEDIYTLQDVLLVSDFDYIKYSNVGSAIGYKNATIYYAPDGRNFTPLPEPPGRIVQQVNNTTGESTHPKFVGEAYISEEGDACFIVSIDHIYAISLVESEWDSALNILKKRWSDWTILNWDSQYSELTYDTNGKLTEKKVNVDSTLEPSLNIINMTKADEPRPHYYTKNFARVINENVFVIFMYAGWLNLKVTTTEDTNGMVPTIFVYNKRDDNPVVHIYQMPDAKDLIFDGDPHVYEDGPYASCAQMLGGDLDLFEHKMLISFAYRHAIHMSLDLATDEEFIIRSNTDVVALSLYTPPSAHSYEFKSGYRMIADELLKEYPLNYTKGYKPIVGDLKLKYSSYSQDTSTLIADINFVFTHPILEAVINPITQKVEYIEKISIYKLTMLEQTTSTSSAVVIKKSGEIGFIGLSTNNLTISRSALRVAIDSGMLVTTDNLSEYQYIPYRPSEEMKTVYIDEDSLISQKIEKLSVPIEEKENGVLVIVPTEDQLELMNKFKWRATDTKFTLVTTDNVDKLGINFGKTLAFTSPDFSSRVQEQPQDRIDYLDKYIATETVLVYTNLIYTTDNVVSTMSVIVEDPNFTVPNITCSAKLIDIYFGSERNLYIGKIMYDRDEKLQLYFSEGLWEEFEETIFQLQILSRNSVGVYCRDSIWIVYSDDNGVYYKSKSKISSSCRNGDSVVLSIDGKGSLYPCHRGIAYIEHQSLVSVEEQQLSFITDDIKNYMIDWIKDVPVKMFNDEFWLYVYSTKSKEMWVMDLRKNTWWRWTTPEPITNMFVYLDELYVLINNKVCKFTDDGDYHDIISVDDSGLWIKNVISWYIESQRLYLGDINRYKHVHSIALNTTVEDDNVENRCVRLKCSIYRTMMSTTPENVLDYKVSGIRSYVKKLNIFKCNFFKFRLSSDTSEELIEENYTQRQMKIEGLSIKYGIRERIR